MSSQRSHRYRVLDVFTREALEGNPLAVFPDNEDFTTETMQKIAKELNLSETVFVQPSDRPDCVARLRIFTPLRELDFAGHPTVGTGFLLIDEGRVEAEARQFLVEENVGPVPIRADGDDPPIIWLTTPPIREGNTYDREVCARAIGLEVGELLDMQPQLFSAGNPTLFIGVKTADGVDRAWFDSSGVAMLKQLHQEYLCVFVFAPVTTGAYSRMFGPEHGIAEDPATGSSTGPLALYMLRHGLISPADGTRFISEQGTKMGRRSLLHVHIRGAGGSDGIDVGGYVTPLTEAVMKL